MKYIPCIRQADIEPYGVLYYRYAPCSNYHRNIEEYKPKTYKLFIKDTVCDFLHSSFDKLRTNGENAIVNSGKNFALAF
jgi:hypothetical protein